LTCRRTDENGGNAAEIRYYPWGTERYNMGDGTDKVKAIADRPCKIKRILLARCYLNGDDVHR
jgi:hypothetical protein